jgi:hypothetical protein
MKSIEASVCNWPGRAVGADGDVVEFRNGATLGAVERRLEIDHI